MGAEVWYVRQALVEQMDVLRCPMRSYRMLLYITVLTYLPCFAFPTRESLNVHSGIVRLSQRFEVFSGTDEEQPAQLSVESQRWRLTRVPEGSWCSSGRTNFESTSPLSVGKLKVTLSKANLTFEALGPEGRPIAGFVTEVTMRQGDSSPRPIEKIRLASTHPC